MSDEVTVAIRLTMQWLFAPLLAIVALAWLCVRLKAAGVFNVIRDSIRKMSIFQRFAAATFLAVFIVFAGEKTNSPPANLPPVILPSVPAVPPEPPRSGAFEVTNLCFTSISVASNETTLGVSWPLDFIGSGSKIDLFAFTSLDAAEQTWLAEHEVASVETNWTLTVDTSCLATGTDVYPPMLFFSAFVRADPGDLRDTDGDTLPDVYEVHNGTNPYVPDYALAPKLTVGPLGTYADIAAAFAASTNYSIVELDSTAVHAVGGIGVSMPAHPVMVCSPPGTRAVVRATGMSAFLLDAASSSRTLFKNIYVLLDAQSGFQAGFWVGGNLPWNAVTASASFEDVYVRMPRTGVEYFGWLLYNSSDDVVSLSRCTVNASGSEWVYGVQSFGASPLMLENCSFVNFPPNGAKTSCGILLRSMPGIGGGADVTVSRCLFDESFTNAVMFGRLEEGESNVLSVADCIVPRNPLEDYPLDEFSGLEVTNAALSWAGFPWPDSPPVSLDIGALSPFANDPLFDTDGDGFCDYVEVYEKGTDPYLVDSDLDGVSDFDEDDQGTDPTNPHSFLQNLTVTVTNTVSLSHAAYVAWGYDPTGWEANGLTMFSTGIGMLIYTNASSSGAAYVKAFCDLDDDGEYSPNTDILLIKSIPQRAMATNSFVFGDVDGDGVTDEQERFVDHTDPYDGGNFRLSGVKLQYTDLDYGYGISNLIEVSSSLNGWDPNVMTNSFTSKMYTNAVDTVVTGGVIYVKCLHDRNGDGMYDPTTERVTVTRLTSTSRNAAINVTVGDWDDDGVGDMQELLDDHTDPYDAKNFRVQKLVEMATSDPVLACTNYLAASPSPVDWSASSVVTSFVCTSASAYVDVVATNGYAYVKCLRDFVVDGSPSDTGDVLYVAPLTARTTGSSYFLRVGDRDGDGVCDSEELAEGTSPSNGMEYCFGLKATAAGIFSPSNGLSVVAYFGTSANVLYGPCTQTNTELTVDFGHLSTVSREKVSFLFWEDLNGNGIWDVGERKTICPFPVIEHTMCVTNVLELDDFDVDGDGMLDDWEVGHGLSPSNAGDAVQDADGDGFLNLYEYIAGTDPNDAEDNGDGTALYAATHGIDDRIAGTDYTIATKYYVGYQPQGTGITGELQNICFQRNTNCWMHGVDMSCLSVYDDGPQGAWRHPLTAITPQHVISATHVCPENGLRVTFQSLSGEVVVRTLVAQTFIPGVADDDLWIGLLDEPLPSCVKPAKLLPPDYALNIGTGRKLPLVRIGNNKSCNLHDIVYLAPSAAHNRMCCLQYSSVPARNVYRRGPVGMDSGHPLFLLFGSELAFVCPARGFYSDNQATGFLCTYYRKLIQKAIDGLSLQLGFNPMAIEDFDLSEYHESSGGGP